MPSPREKRYTYWTIKTMCNPKFNSESLPFIFEYNKKCKKAINGFFWRFNKLVYHNGEIGPWSERGNLSEFRQTRDLLNYKKIKVAWLNEKITRKIFYNPLPWIFIRILFSNLVFSFIMVSPLKKFIMVFFWMGFAAFAVIMAYSIFDLPDEVAGVLYFISIGIAISSVLNYYKDQDTT